MHSGTKGRLSRLCARIVAPALLMGATLVAVVVPAAPAQAYATSAIADTAEAYADYAYGGQCKTFVGNVVQAVAGFYPPGYQQGFANAGATEVTNPANAVRGDIIQITPAGSTDSTAESMYNMSVASARLHTAIIRGPRNADGTYNVIDSNWSTTNDMLVRRHMFNPYTWAAGSIVKIWRFGTGGPSGALEATQAISVGPSDQVAMYTPLNWSFRVRNTTGAAASIQRLVVAVRGPSGNALDVICANGTGVTLQPNQEWTCNANLAQGFGQVGQYTFWADWLDYAGQWHQGQLGANLTLTVSQAPTLSAAQSISVGPSNYRPKLTSLWWSYRVRNTSGAYASIQRLVVAVRGPAGDALDVQCLNGTGVTLAPNQEWTCDAQLPSGYGSTGTFTFWADWLDYGGQWHHGQLGGNQTLVLY